MPRLSPPLNEKPNIDRSEEVPTIDDWRSEPWNEDDFDIAWAFKDFQGKTFEEAVGMFEEDALRYQENVVWMPSRGFGSYVRAYMAYLVSPKSAEDSDGASCFIGLIESKARSQPADIKPLWPEISSVLEHLAANQSYYDANIEIYGDFQQRVQAIRRNESTARDS
jgi:hypothetical protein